MNTLKQMSYHRLTIELARTCEDNHSGPESAMYILFRGKLTNDFSAVPDEAGFYSFLDDECSECLQEAESDYIHDLQEYATKMESLYLAAEKLENALTELWEFGANDTEICALYHNLNEKAKAEGGAV